MSSALRSSLGRGLSQLFEFAFPWRCVLCESNDDSNRHGKFCESCYADLIRPVANSCQRCAAEVGPFVTTEHGCVHCKNKPIRFNSVVCLGMYRETIREAILTSKWSHSSVTMHALAELLAEKQRTVLKAAEFDLVVPIPQPWKRRVVRSFNSAAIIAESLAKYAGAPVDRHLLYRRRSPQLQKRLPLKSRIDNQKNSFGVRYASRLASASVLLVDDVMTTGATCAEASRVLKRNGAKSVHVAVLARVLDPSG